MRAVASALSLSMLVPLVSLSAQVQPPVETGARVRVTSPELGPGRSVGTCLELSEGHMSFAPEAGASPQSLHVDSLTALDVSRGRKSNVGKGAAFGFLAGASLGALAGLTMDQSGPEVTAGQWALMGAGVGGLVGLVVGLGVSPLIKTERWEEVPLDRLRVSVAPQRDRRLGIGLAVAF